MSERNSPEINASSMADIAFLLLIFFLVTSTLDIDQGIVKRLPEKKDLTRLKINDKNILEIYINSSNEILVERTHLIKIENIKQLIIDFVDNGAGTDVNGIECTWCRGKKDINSSDHPAKAVIKLQSTRNTSYSQYISIQNEILAGYDDLRNKLSESLYGKNYFLMLEDFKKNKKDEVLRSKINLLKTRYPELIFEEDPIK